MTAVLRFVAQPLDDCQRDLEAQGRIVDFVGQAACQLTDGRQLPAGTWFSFGFNRFGYRDDELTGEEWTRTGAYLRVRTRFDESLFRKPGVRP